MANQIVGQGGQSLQMILRPAVFNAQVSALDVAGVRQAATNRSNVLASCFERPGFEIADHRHRRLLRPRWKRPRRRAAEQRDEVAPADHSITSSAWASRVGGTSRPSAFAVLRL